MRVVDRTAPVISALPGATKIECPGPARFTTPTGGDACDASPTLTFNDVTTAGSCPQSRVVTRTWTATDHCNNTSTAGQVITVVDTTARADSHPPEPKPAEYPGSPLFLEPKTTDARDANPKPTFN